MKIRLKPFFFWLFVATSLGLSGCAGDEEQFPVTVIVDFGAAGKAPFGKEVTVLPGSTVFNALRLAFPVVTSRR